MRLTINRMKEDSDWIDTDVKSLKKEEELILLKVFNSIDTDNSGKIDKAEFRVFLPKLYEILGLKFSSITKQ